MILQEHTTFSSRLKPILGPRQFSALPATLSPLVNLRQAWKVCCLYLTKCLFWLGLVPALPECVRAGQSQLQALHMASCKHTARPGDGVCLLDAACSSNKRLLAVCCPGSLLLTSCEANHSTHQRELQKHACTHHLRRARC